MNIDQREMRQVAEAAAPRVDMYVGIHKALRALMADNLGKAFALAAALRTETGCAGSINSGINGSSAALPPTLPRMHQ